MGFPDFVWEGRGRGRGNVRSHVSGFFSLYDPCFQTVKWNEVLNYYETLTYISYM